MRYKLSDGNTGLTTMSKEEFQKILLKDITIVSWEEDTKPCEEGKQ